MILISSEPKCSIPDIIILMDVAYVRLDAVLNEVDQQARDDISAWAKAVTEVDDERDDTGGER